MQAEAQAKCATQIQASYLMFLISDRRCATNTHSPSHKIIKTNPQYKPCRTPTPPYATCNPHKQSLTPSAPNHAHISTLHPRGARLKQRLPAGPALLKAQVAGENALAAQKRLPNHALQRLVLVGRDFVAEQHGAGFDLGVLGGKRRGGEE